MGSPGPPVAILKPKSLIYQAALSAVEQRIIDALPDIVDGLICRAKEGDLKAAVYLCDRVLGRVAGSEVPLADDRRSPFTEAEYLLNQHEKETSEKFRKMIAGLGASEEV